MALMAAFLRAMNTGNRRISNEGLRAAFEALGFDDVATFRASGNVIFEGPSGKAVAALARRIEDGLAEHLGYAVPTYLRPAEQIRSIAAFEPFAPDVLTVSRGKLQVVLLHEAPPPDAAKQALALSTDDDLLLLRGSELYWLPSGGQMESALDRDALAGLLGAMTIRTKGTIDLIAARYFGGPRQDQRGGVSPPTTRR